MSRGARLELLARLRAEGRLTDDEYRILTGTGLGWAGALYYVGGGLLLVGIAALAAEFWAGGSIVGHLALSLALDGLLFAGAILLRRRGHESPAMVLLLGSLLASRLLAVSALQVVGPPMTASSGLSGAGALAASAEPVKPYRTNASTY